MISALLVSVKENSHPKIYFLAFLFFSLSFFINTTYGLVLLLSYLILRSFIFPLKKSKKIDFRKFNIIYLFILPIVGISIDLTRFVAYVLSFMKNQVNFLYHLCVFNIPFSKGVKNSLFNFNFFIIFLLLILTFLTSVRFFLVFIIFKLGFIFFKIFII